MNRAILRYYCGNCNNVLKETTTANLGISKIDSCPFCGILIHTSLKKHSITSQIQHKPKPLFQKASQIPKLTLDIPKLDSVLHFLTLGQKICISGIHAQKIIERICVRAQLPSRYGGLNSNVLLIDGANSSDLYQCVDFAQQYGLDDVNKILNGIISSRAFTVYQLTNTILKELHNAIIQYDVKIIVITNLLYYFTNDPYLDMHEMKTILKEIIKTLNKIQNCLVVVSFDISTQYDYLFSELFSRTINIQQHTHSTLSVNIDDNGKKSSLLLKQGNLEIVPQH